MYDFYNSSPTTQFPSLEAANISSFLNFFFSDNLMHMQAYIALNAQTHTHSSMQMAIYYA